MNFADVLKELGAEDSEVIHLIHCDECSVYVEWEDVGIARCKNNPVWIESKRDEERGYQGRALIYGFFSWWIGATPPKPDWMKKLNEAAKSYQEALIEQLNKPLWLDEAKD